MTDINSLNADIYHLLKGYLAREEFQSFLQVNSHVHSEYIAYRYISLKGDSLHYHENEAFRERILSLVRDPRRQLSLNFVGHFSIADVWDLGGVHTLNLSLCNGITDVSALGGVYALNLSACGGIADVPWAECTICACLIAIKSRM